MANGESDPKSDINSHVMDAARYALIAEDPYPWPFFCAIHWVYGYGSVGARTPDGVDVFYNKEEMDFSFKTKPPEKSFPALIGYTIYSTKAVPWPTTAFILRCDKCGARVVEAKVSEVKMVQSTEWTKTFYALEDQAKMHTQRHKEAEER